MAETSSTNYFPVVVSRSDDRAYRAMTLSSSDGSTGLAMCAWKPDARAWSRFSDRAYAVRAIAGSTPFSPCRSRSRILRINV